MPKQRKNDEVQCVYYRWILTIRSGVYYADGRSNPTKLGRYSLAVDTREAALQSLSQLDRVKAVENGIEDRSILDLQASTLSLVEGWNLYLASVEGRQAIRGIRFRTPKRYKPVRDKFIEFCRKRNVTQFGQINKARVLQYGGWLDEEAYAYATVYLELTTIKQMVKYLVEEGHLPASASFKLSLTKPDESDTYCYTPAEVGAMLHHCQTTQDLKWLHVVLSTLVYTGMRISELATLRWTDLELDATDKRIRLIDERHSAARRKAGNARELKGRRSRHFPIRSELLPILKSIPRSQDGYVFHGSGGGRLKPDRVRTALIRDVLTPLKSQFPTRPGEALGFADGRVHSFRHVFCSICANSNTPEQTLMSWLGHRSSKMIKRYYHLHDAASQTAMAKVDFSAVINE